jgi:hypothetical protein
MSDRKCANCQYYGGLNMDALPAYGLHGTPLGGYWCFAMNRYMVDTKIECIWFIAMVPEGATCAHPNMCECCGHYHCPDCRLTWDDGDYGDL